MTKDPNDGRVLVGSSGARVVIVIDSVEGSARVVLSREGAIRISDALRRASRSVGAAVERRGLDE